MSTVINVTAEHIAAGVQKSCSHCPVALAIADALPEVFDISVAGPRVVLAIADTSLDLEVDLPGKVEEFVVRFDDDGFGEPFSFTLDYPEVAS